MTNRRRGEQLFTQLYDARVHGRLDAPCTLSAPDAAFRIAGASDGKPVAIAARGSEQNRSWLSMLVKSFGNREFFVPC